jgi:hypothetical protein
MEDAMAHWISSVQPRFFALSPVQQTSVLALWALDLTIVARGHYPPLNGQPSGAHASKLIALNEVQHRIIGHLSRVVERCDERYPDDVFLEIVLNLANGRHCAAEVAAALDRALRIVGLKDVEPWSLEA